MSETKVELENLLEEKKAIIGIIGLGYVGLPLVLAFTQKGYPVVGLDIDDKKVKMLRNDENYIRHIPSEQITPLIKTEQFHPTADFSKLRDCHVVILCVPTPLNKYREPDMSFVEATTQTVSEHLQPGQLVVLESTTYPGTTDGLVRNILESNSKLKAGEDFFLAYSPEREDPGNPKFMTQTIPKVVGGFSEDCTAVASKLYRSVVNEVIPVSNTRIGEMTKLLENIFRSVNIALVNELKIVAQAMGIDIWEVIAAASSKPFGFMPFYPGPGLGGHCIPIDPFYLTWKAREFGLSTRFIELAGEVNTSMPSYVIQRLTSGLNEHSKPVRGSKILVMGLAYKKDVDDQRESPSIVLIEMLRAQGAEVSYHDPMIPHAAKMRSYNIGLTSVDLTPENLANSDAVLISTDHTDVDYQMICDHASLVVDTRNATRNCESGKALIIQS